ncbi:MAG: Calx-beta domain-containing protein [Odoribacter sp.]
MKLYTKLIFLLAFFSVVLLACDDNDDASVNSGQVTVAFGASRQEVFENVSPQRISLTLSAPARQNVVVKVAVKSEDGVREGIDYKIANYEVHIAKGEIGGYVEFFVKDCFEVLPDRTVVLEMVEVSGAAMSGEMLTCKIIIVSNEGFPTLGFKETLQSVAEECGEYQLAVLLTRPINQAVTFLVEAVDSTAIRNVHYSLDNVHFTIPAGDTLVYVPVGIVNDDDVNATRKFVLCLKDINGAALSKTNYNVDVIVVNDDRDIYASFKETGLKVFEDTNRVEIPVVLSNEIKKEVKVKLKVDPSTTAKEGKDYVLPENMVLTFAAGVTEQQLAIDVKNNDLLDGDRRLVLAIDSVYNASMAETNTSYSLTIMNEDVDFALLYDKLIGTYKLTYIDTDKSVEKTCIISAGDDLVEENQNYLKVLKLNIDGMGALGKTAKIAIQYDVKTGGMTIPMKQTVIRDASFGRPEWNHVDIVLYIWDEEQPKDGVVTLTWNKGYTACDWELSIGDVIYALLCEKDHPDKIVQGNVRDFSFKSVKMMRTE